MAMALALAPTYTLGPVGWRDMALAAGVVVGAWAAGGERGAIEVAWSPYQKLAVHPGRAGMGDYMVSVNNCGGFQWMIDLSPETQAADPGRYPMAAPGLSEYDLPTALHTQPRKVLTVGAGSGNGTAAALRGGAEEVVAVEIDPAIIAFGRRYHPEQPYQDPRVGWSTTTPAHTSPHPARSSTCIVFGLLDSHTTTAA